MTAISNALVKLLDFLPDLIGAFLILGIGWIIATILAKAVTQLLRKLHFNQAADHAGFSHFIVMAGLRQHDPSSVMGELIKWFFRVLALIAACSVLQLPALNAALLNILNFIPNLGMALLIVLIGSLVARISGDFIKGAAHLAGFSNVRLLSNIVRYAILYVAVMAALGQIGVAATVIDTIFIGTIAALALAFGLAFGLGGRDTAAQIWQSGYKSVQENLPKLSKGIEQQARQIAEQQQQQQQLQAMSQTASGVPYQAIGQPAQIWQQQRQTLSGSNNNNYVPPQYQQIAPSAIQELPNGNYMQSIQPTEYQPIITQGSSRGDSGQIQYDDSRIFMDC
jgi:hypothetical protein